MKNDAATKNPHAVALGRQRMSTLSPGERSALATRASHAALAVSTSESRQARAQIAIAARWAGHVSTDPRLDPITYLLSRGKITAADLARDDYKISAARYARRYLLIRCTPRGDGYKTRADRLLHDGLNCRNTGHENGFIVSVPKAERFISLYAEGWDANAITGTLIPPAPPPRERQREDRWLRPRPQRLSNVALIRYREPSA